MSSMQHRISRTRDSKSAHLKLLRIMNASAAQALENSHITYSGSTVSMIGGNRRSVVPKGAIFVKKSTPVSKTAKHWKQGGEGPFVAHCTPKDIKTYPALVFS